MKKIIIPLFTLFMVLINLKSIKAANINDEIYIDYSFSYPVATTKFMDHSKYVYDYEHPIRRKSDNKILYCLSAHTKVVDNAIVTGYNNDDDINRMMGLTQDERERIKKIAYYGYGYQEHTSMDWYVATQIMIWRITNINDNPPYPVEDGDTFLTYSTKYDNMINEINNLVDNDKNKTNLSETSVEATVGTNVMIVDFNNMLEFYNAVYDDTIDVQLYGDLVLINSNKFYSGVVNLVPKINEETIIYEGANQILISIGDLKKEPTSINIKFRAGYVEGDKQDSEYKIQGEATLVGAVYNIYDLENNFITSVTTGRAGHFKSEELNIGKYYMKEVKAPDGYKIDNEKHYFEINNVNLHPVLLLHDEVIKNNISILKQYTYVDNNTSFLNAEANVTFEIYNRNTKYATITTDQNGYASITLPYGTYRFHQVNTVSGYSKINDFYVLVNNDSNENQYYNILNNKLSAYLKVVKIDEETNNVIEIENTTFKILNLDTNKYVSQNVGDKIYSEFKTDEKGIMTTPLKLEAGHYRLIEIEAPNGYLLGEPIDFEIGDNTNYIYTTYGPYVTLYYRNKPIKGLIEIYKKGEEINFSNNELDYTEKSLENTIFNIYAYEDIKASDNSFNYYQKDELIDTLTTDEYGYARSILLPLGKYKVVEIETNDNYLLDSNEYIVEIDKADNYTNIVYKELNLVNKLKTNLLNFTKLDEDTNEPLENVEIEIYDELDDLIMTKYTNHNGMINLQLPLGRYYLKEKNTLDGYIKNEDIFYFEIIDDEETIINMYNKKIEESNRTIELNEENNSFEEETSNEEPKEKIIPSEEEIKEDETLSFKEENSLKPQNTEEVIETNDIGSTNVIEDKITESVTKIINNLDVTSILNAENEIEKNIDPELEINVPNTELKNSNFLKALGIILIIFGIGLIYHDKKKK